MQWALQHKEMSQLTDQTLNQMLSKLKGARYVLEQLGNFSLTYLTPSLLDDMQKVEGNKHRVRWAHRLTMGSHISCRS
jgi:hypothetical protein